MTNKKLVIASVLPMLVLFLVILPTSGGNNQTTWIPDYWPTIDWQTSSPEAQGMDSAYLTALDEYIMNEFWGNAMVSTLIIKNGYLVHETYYDDFWDGNYTRNIFSCTKSVTSTLLGIAIEEGYISSVDEPVLDFFPNRTFANTDTRKQTMTILDLLTMTAGFNWIEAPYTSSESHYMQMTESDDWVQFVLDRPMEYTPGEFWEYNTGASHLLSAILNVSTGMFTQHFAEERLFLPLGITEYSWTRDPQGNVNGGSNLNLRPRDMAKFGFLFLNNGTWDGVQIVPANWAATATAQHITLSETTGYGYQWWVHPRLSAYSARGYLGQLIYVFPQLNMIVIFTASTNALEDSYLIENYILPSAGIIPGGYTPNQGALITAGFVTIAAIIAPIASLGVYLLYRRKQLVR